jgi:hypothetical protein
MSTYVVIQAVDADRVDPLLLIQFRRLLIHIANFGHAFAEVGVAPIGTGQSVFVAMGPHVVAFQDIAEVSRGDRIDNPAFHGLARQIFGGAVRYRTFVRIGLFAR